MERLTERAEVDGCPGIWVKEGFAHDGLKTWFNGCDEGYSAIDKCAGYEDAEEQGLLLRLPCKEGTQVYCICRCGETCYDHDMDCVNCGEHNVVFATSFDRNMTEQFGKTVFLTREEAEHMLAETKSDTSTVCKYESETCDYYDNEECLKFNSPCPFEDMEQELKQMGE